MAKKKDQYNILVKHISGLIGITRQKKSQFSKISRTKHLLPYFLLSVLSVNKEVT